MVSYFLSAFSLGRLLLLLFLIKSLTQLSLGRATIHYQAAESWVYIAPATQSHGDIDPLERVVRLASGSAVVIFSISTCCRCHAVTRLFCGMGVNPTVYELDQDPRGEEIERSLARLLLWTSPAVLVVFIGGKLVGAIDRVMVCHINGTLVPLLKEAGALSLSRH